MSWAFPFSMLTLSSDHCSIHVDHPSASIDRAVQDLARDLEKIFGAAPSRVELAEAVIRIAEDDSLPAESWRIRCGERIEIAGGDKLGVIYGVYAFTHCYLGVDPLWFWKDAEPQPQTEIEIPAEETTSGPPTFRWRGWFINDEDLLGQWRDSGKQRFTGWPKRDETLAVEDNEFYEKRLLKYYSPIIAADVMEAVFEALLRLGGNLIIPASFIDIMNPDEAAIIQAAIARGFYVSQHHVEPIGVSHFAYETWWAGQGKAPAFSYRDDPDAMRACWRAYAEEWTRIAGDRLLWQVGLRGRGDRPLWAHDPEAKARAGEFISGALADQMEIIQAVDARPNPPATMTLWLEGAQLIESGDLSAPKNVILVFADHDLTQEMRNDFHSLPREADRDYGVYYHIAVWCFGPHLAQGLPPEKIAATAKQIADKGDTAYAILNVANLREHCLGAQVWSEQVWRPGDFDADAFLERWAPPGTARLYRDFFAAVPELRPGWRLYDGCARTFICKLLREATGVEPPPEVVREYAVNQRADLQAKLATAIKRLDALLASAQGKTFYQPSEAQFFRANLIVQAFILRDLYRAVLALLDDEPDFAAAAAALREAIAMLPRAEQGRWQHWYRGDTKVGLHSLAEGLESAAALVAR